MRYGAQSAPVVQGRAHRVLVPEDDASVGHLPDPTEPAAMTPWAASPTAWTLLDVPVARGM